MNFSFFYAIVNFIINFFTFFLFRVDEGKSIQVIEENPKKLYRAKLLKFQENRRPPYYGTWRKKSQKVGPRKPFAQDTVSIWNIDLILNLSMIIKLISNPLDSIRL